MECQTFFLLIDIAYYVDISLPYFSTFYVLKMLQAKANAAQRLKELEVMKIELLEMTESNEKKSKELLKHSGKVFL